MKRKSAARIPATGEDYIINQTVAPLGNFHSSSSSQQQQPQKEKNHTDEPSIPTSFPLKKVLLTCLVFRAVNSLLVQTYFNPDEHWQALEVAHHIVFGYGHLTWEWKKGIRSYLHPLIFAFLYKVFAFLHLDTRWFMIRGPRLLQSIFAAFGDLYLYRLSLLIFNASVAKWALFSQLTNWFMFFCITRTLSNSLETVLTIMGLFYWSSFKNPATQGLVTSRRVALVIAAFACAIRPTGAITWLYVGLLHLFETRGKLKFLFLEVLPIGALVLAVTCFLDHWMYGSWVFVPLNFLRFNFLSSGGDYYGTHKWHWYITQGFPVMLFTFLPFSASGVFHSKEWKLPGLIAWVIGLYSVLGHKEFRFVLPVLPLALMFSGYSLAAMENINYSKKKMKKPSNLYLHCLSRTRLAVLFLLATNIPMALYMSLTHQGGSEAVMNFLSNEAANGKVESILFLMPCHSTPYYSALHHNVSMRFLDCSPSDEKGYLDESDRFMRDPQSFSLDMALTWSSPPSHIILFDAQERQLEAFLFSHSYHQIKKFSHAHFKVDRDLQAFVLVYALRGQYAAMN